VLQEEAQKSKRERQESNRKKREAEQRLERIQQKFKKFPTALPVSQDTLAQSVEAEDHEIEAKWQIRSNQRNKGMTANFEQHVRCVLATRATARQVLDGQLLDANFMLSTNSLVSSSAGRLRYRM
jgi:hypothetical protein